MVEAVAPSELARQARQAFADQLANAVPRLLDPVLEAARVLLDKPAERSIVQQRRDNLQSLMTLGSDWIKRLSDMLRDAGELTDRTTTISGELVASLQGANTLTLELVDDETVQREIFVSRVAQGVVDLAVWELNDLQTRIAWLENRAELDDHDIFRPHELAKVCVKSFFAVGLPGSAFAGVEQGVKGDLALLANEAYHDANHFLMQRGVMPEVNLRTLIRRSVDSRNPMVAASKQVPLDAPSGGNSQFMRTTFDDSGYGAGGGYSGRGGGGSGGGGGGEYNSTRGGFDSGSGGSGGPGGGGFAGGGGMVSGGAMAGGGMGGASGPGGGGAGGADGGGGGGGAAGGPGGAGGQGGRGAVGSPAGSATGFGGRGGAPGRSGFASSGSGSGSAFGVHTGPGTVSAGHHPFANAAEVTLERFGKTMERHVRGFMQTERHVPPSAELVGAMEVAQRGVVQTVEARRQDGADVGPTEMVAVLQEQKQALKKVAATHAERATIEVVAMMFQAILTEERIPATVRVWFARLQMPVLRVAVSEPDFFSSTQHPARRLIDRMGACVLGFDAAPEATGEALESEVARVVQVVEAFPETGRKVFQTVLVEFERFLERYFRDQNETTRKGVSLAQQVEQRETMAIQYTIELRKMLDGMPVQDGVREFLFQVWADVLATTAMRHGQQSPETRGIRDIAVDLVWIAGAKNSREERAEVIRRLAPLLASLRKGMVSGGVSAKRQEELLRALNVALTAAFAARTAAVDPEQLDRLKSRLEALDEILPEADDFEIDDSFALDLSGHETDELEVVAEGGQVPGAAALAATDEMQVGAWYMLEYRDRHEPVQLAWQGLRKQLSLFVSARGRCVLFQRRRLAGFLQARLLTPAQSESLTIAATRSVIEKINANPGRLR